MYIKMSRENTTPSTVLFQTLDWQTFQENVNYRQALMIYKAINNGAPGYMKDIFIKFLLKLYCKILY